MTVHELQIKLLNFQEEGLRLLKMCMQYPGFPVSSIPGYGAWLNNLYQYEQKYLSGHRIHDQFQIGFRIVDNPQEKINQLLQCLEIVNKDQLFWDDLKQTGLSVLENSRSTTSVEHMPRQVDNQSGLLQQAKPTVFLSYNWGSDKTAD
ncbi:MAG: hypothetical protein IKE29_02085, partial [Paenibacillus sp.]|uniref:hypothetical protein n=1 Tax=Paenibacillus sp. TaxID=58172 RepID=UPI0025DB3148